MNGFMDSMSYFNPAQAIFPEMSLSVWDLNFDDIAIPELDRMGPSPSQSTETSGGSKKSKGIARDASRGHEAFKRSPWLWEPEPKDYVQRGKEDLAIRDEGIRRSLNLGRILKSRLSRLKMNLSVRDRVFSIVLAENKEPHKVPSFPSLELLNYLLLVHFVDDEQRWDSWLHSGSFDSSTALPLLLASLVSHGAMFVPIPAIWHFGLAMHEVVRSGINTQVRPEAIHFDLRRFRSLAGIKTPRTHH
jgi:hypothetical protein